MSFHHFYRQLEQNAQQLFPGIKNLPAVTWDHLISPLEVKLSRPVFDTVTQAVRSIYALSRKAEYRALLPPQAGISEKATPNHSLLMAYDFHTTEDGQCSLVEINTNASGYLMASLMEMTHHQISATEYQPLLKLRSSFENELRLCGKPTQAAKIWIIDDDLENQKMFAEFVMYQDWLRSNGWSAEIKEARGLIPASGIDLIYNRSTDFYLEEEGHAELRKAFLSGQNCLSPNPFEYWLLADKERLIHLTQPGFLESCKLSQEEIEAIRKVLIPTFDKSHFSTEDEIWAQRKHLFFKPKRSFGGKSVYRGESVSRKVFERLMADDILIQRYAPAQKVPSDDERSVLSNWKFDLRAFVYEDQVLLMAARIYQGQVTNFSSPMGGFTLVRP